MVGNLAGFFDCRNLLPRKAEQTQFFPDGFNRREKRMFYKVGAVRF